MRVSKDEPWQEGNPPLQKAVASCENTVVPDSTIKFLPRSEEFPFPIAWFHPLCLSKQYHVWKMTYLSPLPVTLKSKESLTMLYKNSKTPRCWVKLLSCEGGRFVIWVWLKTLLFLRIGSALLRVLLCVIITWIQLCQCHSNSIRVLELPNISETGYTPWPMAENEHLECWTEGPLVHNTSLWAIKLSGYIWTRNFWYLTVISISRIKPWDPLHWNQSLQYY